VAPATGPSRRLELLLLVGIGVIYVGLAVTAALVMPWDARTEAVRTPPDELAHLIYVHELATTGRLPVFTSGSGNYEAHQPPLYYLTCLPFYFAARAASGAPATPAAFAAGFLACRLWSVFIGLGVVLASYVAARELFPERPVLRLGTTALVAWLPSHLINCAAVTNDGLAELWCTLALWQLLRAARAGMTGRGAVWLGLLAGLGLLTKSHALFLLPLFLVPVWGAHAEGRAGRRWLRPVLALLIALVLAGWWYGRNTVLYGDPLAQRAFVTVFGVDRPTPGTFLTQPGWTIGRYLLLVALWTAYSFWGVAGQAAVFMGEGAYAVGAGLWAGALLGGAMAWLRRREEGEAEAAAKRQWWVMGLAVGLVGLVYLRFNADFFQAQARYLFPAVLPLAALHVCGWWWAGAVAGRRGQPGVRAGVVAVALALSCVLVLAGVCLAGLPGGAPLWPPPALLQGVLNP